MTRAEISNHFSEIFENVLAFQSEITNDGSLQIQPEWSSDLDPMHMAYLVANLQIEPLKRVSNHKNPYLKYRKVITKPDHMFSSEAQKAFDLINSYLSDVILLPKNFSPLELKRSYKKAALRAHPDCGGTHERFLRLKSSFEMLLAFLKTIK